MIKKKKGEGGGDDNGRGRFAVAVQGAETDSEKNTVHMHSGANVPMLRAGDMTPLFACYRLLSVAD